MWSVTIAYVLIDPSWHKKCPRLKSFNPLPFPAVWCHLRQMLSLAVAVWGSAKKTRKPGCGLFFGGRARFSAVLCFEGSTVWYHYGFPPGDVGTSKSASSLLFVVQPCQLASSLRWEKAEWRTKYTTNTTCGPPKTLNPPVHYWAKTENLSVASSN